ncbi:AAA family ATPase [Methanoregula sp.]|jgi:predicted ATPase|uniref:AAA family ATPase n=1 Tax=Methanoregula sp. TaxID=2052170 RepID=UPI00356A550D
MTLSKIEIKGYKSIQDLDLDLKSLNVLIGANGSGKTNFISIFKFLNQLTEENLNLHVKKSGGADSFLYYGQKHTPHLDITLNFGANLYQCRLAPTINDSFIFEMEEVAFHNKGVYDNPLWRSLGTGHQETLLNSPSLDVSPRRISNYVLTYLKSWRVYHFHDTSDTAPVKRQGDINDNFYLRSDAANLAAYLYSLKKTHPNHYQKIRDTIQLVAPFFDDFILRPMPDNEKKIQLEWREKGSDYPFLAYHLSDGTLRFMCLTTLLLQPRPPSTILVDEPELGLHPYAINTLASLIKSAATRTQIIISTQSVPLVNQFNLEDLLVVNRRNQATVIERLKPEEFASWLEDYSVGELWEKNVIGGRPSR